MTKPRDIANLANPSSVSEAQLASGCVTNPKVSPLAAIMASKAVSEVAWNGNTLPSAVTRNLQEKVSDVVSVRDFGAAGDGIANDAVAIQAAYNALNSNGRGGTILLPPGKYKIGSPVVIAGAAVTFQGEGYSMSADVGTGAGTWLFIDDPSFIPFRVAGGFNNGVRGTVFRDIAVQQAHPEPDPAASTFNPPTVGGWQPTNYPEVFWLDATGGEVTFENVYVPGCRLFIKSNDTGRINIRNVFGQFFDGLLDVDTCYDVMRIDNVHSWPYWRINSDVFLYCVDNLDLFKLGRVDTPFINNIFTLPARSIIRTVQTAAGFCTKLISHNLTGDFAKYGLWIQSPNFLSQIACLNIYHEGIPLGSDVPIPGARAIYVTSANAFITLASLSSVNLFEESIEVTAPGTQILVGESNFEKINRAGGTGVVKTASSSIVRFAIPPRIINSGNCPLTSPASFVNAETSTLQVWQPNSINYVQTVAAPTGNAVQVKSVGGDASVDLQLDAWGNGNVSMNAPLKLSTYTTATRPSAPLFPNCLIFVSDAVSKVQYSDGSSWIGI